MSVREALYSIADAMRDPRAVMTQSNASSAPDPITDPDAAMLYRCRWAVAMLALENMRLGEELYRAKGSQT